MGSVIILRREVAISTGSRAVNHNRRLIILIVASPFPLTSRTHFLIGGSLSHNSVPLSFSEEELQSFMITSNLSYNFFHLI